VRLATLRPEKVSIARISTLQADFFVSWENRLS
jgi:hypothetical protein